MNNNGTLRKQTGNTGTSVIHGTFNNTGTVECLSGTLSVGYSSLAAGNSTAAAIFTSTSPGILIFAGGNGLGALLQCPDGARNRPCNRNCRGNAAYRSRVYATGSKRRSSIPCVTPVSGPM